MRALAKDLHISVITTKRAYEELERDGFIHTMVGRGSFIADANMEMMKEEKISADRRDIDRRGPAGEEQRD